MSRPPRKTLNELNPGDRCVVRKIQGSGAVFQRLLEMGLISDTPVAIVRYAPLGDPMEIELRGYHLSLRKSEAAMIEVDPAH